MPDINQLSSVGLFALFFTLTFVCALMLRAKGAFGILSMAGIAAIGRDTVTRGSRTVGSILIDQMTVAGS